MEEKTHDTNASLWLALLAKALPVESKALSEKGPSQQFTASTGSISPQTNQTHVFKFSYPLFD
jgi:hypothetical protein